MLHPNPEAFSNIVKMHFVSCRLPATGLKKSIMSPAYIDVRCGAVGRGCSRLHASAHRKMPFNDSITRRKSMGERGPPVVGLSPMRH
jgi:hypothetical protein